jgi:hypothetical protein
MPYTPELVIVQEGAGPGAAEAEALDAFDIEGELEALVAEMDADQAQEMWDPDLDLDALSDAADDAVTGEALAGLAAPPSAEPSRTPLPPGRGKFQDDPGNDVWDTQMRELTNEWTWEPFRFTYKHEGPGMPNGAMQATCPYHRLTETTGCKKTMNFPSRRLDDVLRVMWTLRHWCNRAHMYSRQRNHVLPRKLDVADTPDIGVILAARLTKAPAAFPPTDVELDRGTAGPPPAGQGAAADAAASRASRARGARARVTRVNQGRGRRAATAPTAASSSSSAGSSCHAAATRRRSSTSSSSSSSSSGSGTE